MDTAVSSPAPSAPSSGSDGGGSSSTASTPSAAPAAETKEPSPQTTRESSRELLRRQTREALEKSEAKPAPESESSEAETEKVEGSEAPKDGAEEGQKVEAKPVEEKKEPESEDKLRIREVLKAIPDKKTRERIAELSFIGKELKDAGIRVADAKAYRELFPTPEVGKQASETAASAYNLANAFHSNTPEGLSFFRDNLRNANPAAHDNLVASIADDLSTIAPKKYREIGQKTSRNVIANLKNFANQHAARGDETGAHDWNTAAQMLEEFLFPQGMNRPQSQRPQNDPVMQENARLKAQFEQAQNERLQYARQSAFTAYHQGLEAEAARILKEADSDGVYGDKARARMAAEIVNSVRNKIGNNQHIRMAVESLLSQGNSQAAADHLISQAKPLLLQDSASVIADYADLFEKKHAVREAKQAVVAAKKDVGAPASAPKTTAPNKPVDTRGMNSRQALRAFVSKRMAG